MLEFSKTESILHPPRWYRWWDGPGVAWFGLASPRPQTLRPWRQPLVPAGAQWVGGADLPDGGAAGRVHSSCRVPKPRSKHHTSNTDRAGSPVRTICWRAGPESFFRATATTRTRRWGGAGAQSWRGAWRWRGFSSSSSTGYYLQTNGGLLLWIMCITQVYDPALINTLQSHHILDTKVSHREK